jgi:hypothetical protein
MNRADYFNLIEGKLSWLSTRLEIRGRLNILDLNIHSENFYLNFLNLLFGWDLKNLNVVNPNAAGLDLVDITNKTIIQVSATATRQKVESALAKDLSAFKGFSFKFISISKDASELKHKVFLNPHNLTFTPVDDIYDIPSLLRLISSMEIDQLKAVHDFIKKELKTDPDPGKTESNLTTIINILSKEDWNSEKLAFETVPYEIDAKISHNQLTLAAGLINDYKIHFSRIDKFYTDFDRLGANKSLSILNSIRADYFKLSTNNNSDECFFAIIEKVIERVQKSANYIHIPEEELKLCVEILVVDAFIRCKIFKNPLESTDASS